MAISENISFRHICTSKANSIELHLIIFTPEDRIVLCTFVVAPAICDVRLVISVIIRGSYCLGGYTQSLQQIERDLAVLIERTNVCLSSFSVCWARNDQLFIVMSIDISMIEDTLWPYFDVRGQFNDVLSNAGSKLVRVQHV
ncbi:hypothetical protein [Edaphobacter modestus]|uniref:hypothetical protein n=1 Tax=Edaphobacter modestus TaxID=388466 RepID=UPI0013EE762A|nr:hypothetical protein [Edaphobacter modestus]